MVEINISVVIPVYNAKPYIQYAVESALAQEETYEVILVDDGSTDGGLAVCQELSQQYHKVKLFQHPNGKNHGAAAARNLGIKNSSCSYVAFLDADDYFLLDRFSSTINVFHKYEDADGVYEAIGAAFQNNEVKEKFTKIFTQELTTIREIIPPDQLFERLLRGGIGHFSLDGLTLKKKVFQKTGLFCENLKIFEDTEMMYRLCALSTLYHGNINQPVAIRRVHSSNRITSHLADKRKTYKSNIILWNTLAKWAKKNITKENQDILLHHYIANLRKVDTFPDFSWIDYLQSRARMAKLGFQFPRLLISHFFWRRIVPSKEIFH